MPDFHEFDVRYVAPMTVVRSGRKQAAWTRATARVRIPELSPADAPVVVDVHEAKAFLRTVRRQAGDRLVEPVRIARVINACRKAGAAVDLFAAELAAPETSCDPLFGEGRPWGDAQVRKAQPLDGVRIVGDGRPAVEDLIQQAAANLVVVDGHVHRIAPEPYLRVSVELDDLISGRPRLFAGVASGPGPVLSGGFRLDNREAAARIVAHCESVGFGVTLFPPLEVRALDAGALRLDEGSLNARFALALAIQTAGRCLMEVPPEGIGMLAEASRLHAAFGEGEGDVRRAAALLEDLSGIIPATDATRGLWAGLTVGLTALESSAEPEPSTLGIRP